MVSISSFHPNLAVKSAYANAKALVKEDVPNATSAGGFQDMVADAAQNAVKTIREGDAIAQAGLEGKVGIQEVVEATMAMESTLKVSVALRDKLVGAYQEILRMPI